MGKLYFTAKAIKAIQPEPKNVFLSDDVSSGGEDGLSLEVKATGRKVFFWRRQVNGTQRRVTIGEFPSYSVAAARIRAQELNVQLHKEGFKEEVEVLTLRQFWDETYKKRELPKKTPSTQRGYKDAIRRLKKFHDRPLNEVTRAEIAELLGQIGETSEATSNKVRSLWLRIYNLAIELDRIENRPPFPKPYRIPPRTRYLNNKEVARLLKALQGYEYQYALYFRTVLFTGSRKTEVCKMRWDQLQWEGKLWLRHQKGGTLAPTALPDQLVKELKKWQATQNASKKMKGTPWVFPSTKNPLNPLNDPMKHWRGICKVAEIKNANIHTLRHTHASWMVQDGTSLAVIGKQLGHRQASTTERYAHLDVSSAQRAVNSIAKKMTKGIK